MTKHHRVVLLLSILFDHAGLDDGHYIITIGHQEVGTRQLYCIGARSGLSSPRLLQEVKCSIATCAAGLMESNHSANSEWWRALTGIRKSAPLLKPRHGQKRRRQCCSTKSKTTPPAGAF